MFTSDYFEINTEECLSTFFSPQHERATHAACIRNYITVEVLRDWANEFNLFLANQFIYKYSLQKWASHFGNWLPKQDKSKPPPHLSMGKAPETKLQKNVTANISAKEKNRLFHERNNNNQ